MLASRRMQASHSEAGMTTAEYAVGTVAATGFAGVLYLLAPFWKELIRRILFMLLTLLPFLNVPLLP